MPAADLLPPVGNHRPSHADHRTFTCRSQEPDTNPMLPFWPLPFHNASCPSPHPFNFGFYPLELHDLRLACYHLSCIGPAMKERPFHVQGRFSSIDSMGFVYLALLNLKSRCLTTSICKYATWQQYLYTH